MRLSHNKTAATNNSCVYPAGNYRNVLYFHPLACRLKLKIGNVASHLSLPTLGSGLPSERYNSEYKRNSFPQLRVGYVCITYGNVTVVRETYKEYYICCAEIVRNTRVLQRIKIFSPLKKRKNISIRTIRT